MKLFGRLLSLTGPTLVALLMLPATSMAEGMPQLDFKTPLTTSQVVWGAIIFVVLYILLSRTGLPMVASVLEERATRIAKDLDEARAAKASADAAMGFGFNANASSISAMAFGKDASATNQGSVAIGQESSSTGTASTAIGFAGRALANETVAVGDTCVTRLRSAARSSAAPG